MSTNAYFASSLNQERAAVSTLKGTTTKSSQPPCKKIKETERLTLVAEL